MKTKTKTAGMMLSGAAAVALTIGIGGVGPDGSATATTTHPSNAAPGISGPVTPGGSTGVHAATLTDCIIGLDC